MNGWAMDQGKKHVNSVQQSLSGFCYCASIHILRFFIKSLASWPKLNVISKTTSNITCSIFFKWAFLNIMPVMNISKSMKWRAWNICCNRMSKIKLHLKQISKLQRCHVLKSMTDVTRPMSSKRFHATWSNCSTWLLRSTNFTGPRKQASTQTNLIKTLRLTFFIYW